MFQSAPLTEARGDRGYRPADESLWRVSIRSPHRSKGRRWIKLRVLYRWLFQSAPLTEARGDYAIKLKHPDFSLFQSAPLTEARGDLVQGCEYDLHEEFQSAPLTEARGDRGNSLLWMCLAAFQSAPLTEARGDTAGIRYSHHRLCFNPLPSPKQGETGFGLLPYRPRIVSIRSPHRSKGRP